MKEVHQKFDFPISKTLCFYDIETAFKALFPQPPTFSIGLVAQAGVACPLTIPARSLSLNIRNKEKQAGAARVWLMISVSPNVTVVVMLTKCDCCCYVNIGLPGPPGLPSATHKLAFLWQNGQEGCGQ